MRRQVPLLLVTRHIRFRRIRSGLGGLGTDVATCVAGLVRVIAVKPTNVISCELNIATTSTFAIICVHPEDAKTVWKAQVHRLLGGVGMR